MNNTSYTTSWYVKAGYLLAALFLYQYPAKAESADSLLSNKVPPISFSITLPEAVAIKPENDIISGWFRGLVDDPYISLRLVNHKSDPAGNKHYRYLQYFKGIPVAHSMINIHFRDGKIYSANGSYFIDQAAPAIPAIDPPTAFSRAIATVPATAYAWNDSLIAAALHLQDSSIDYHKAPSGILYLLPDMVTGHLQLAYRFDIYALSPMQRKIVYIDALNGNTLYTEEQIQTIDRPGIAHTRYSGLQSIVCDSISSGLFELTESGRGGGIGTYNAGKDYVATTVKFTDDDNNWNNINPDQDEVATDVHWGMEMAYGYFKNKLSRNSYDDANAKLTGMVHAGIKYNNAHWDGTFAIFGDGDSVLYRPLVTPDICVHELSHGITGTTAKLVFLDEMGALNESFSDILAHGALHYASPATFSWQVAPGVQYDGLPMRDMQNPHNTLHPKYYHGLYYYTGHDDNGGIHTNSGVQNYWFYLLCEGGSGIRESDGAPFTITAIGMDKAEQIAYSTLTDYLFPLAQYKDAATLSVTAATALYGISSDEARQVQMAWYAVGLAEKPVSIDLLPNPHKYIVAPNPTSGILYITKDFNADCSLRLTSLLGQTMYSNPAFQGPALDISSLPAGSYLMELTESGQVNRMKISKQ